MPLTKLKVCRCPFKTEITLLLSANLKTFCTVAKLATSCSVIFSLVMGQRDTHHVVSAEVRNTKKEYPHFVTTEFPHSFCVLKRAEKHVQSHKNITRGNKLDSEHPIEKVSLSNNTRQIAFHSLHTTCLTYICTGHMNAHTVNIAFKGECSQKTETTRPLSAGAGCWQLPNPPGLHTKPLAKERLRAE